MKSMFYGTCENPIFEIEPTIQLTKINDKRVMINPRLGGWAAVSDEDMIVLLRPNSRIPRELGEAAYQHGLARKNGYAVFNPELSPFQDRMAFFEFHVSDQCNLACKYCSSSTKPVKVITSTPAEVGRQWVDRISDFYRNHKPQKVILEFTGGEPLANADFIDETLTYARQKLDPRVEVETLIVSNLTVLTERQIDLIKKHKIRINVSLDGPAEDNDGQRIFASGRGTFDVVMNNIQKLAKVGISLKGVQSVVTSRTVPRLVPIADYFLNDLGFTDMTFAYMSDAGARPGSETLRPDPKAFVDQLFNMLDQVFIPHWEKTGVMPYTRYLSVAFAYLLEPVRSYMCQASPCGAGKNIIATKSNGDVYGCACGPWDDELKLGNIYSDSFEECQMSDAALASASRKGEDIPKCSTCLYLGWCRGGCPKDAFSRHGSIFREGGNCEMYQALWGRALECLVEGRYAESAIRELAKPFLI